MIYEFAVSPNLFSNEEEIKFIRESFKMGSGRFISEIPKKKWFEEIRRIIRSNSENQPIKRKRMLNATEKIFREKILYKRNTQPKEDFSQWADYVITAHKERAFRAIIVDKNPAFTGNYPILKSDIEIVDNEFWSVPRNIIINRDAKSMAEAIKPMIDCSQELILVDKHFKPKEKRFREVLFAILEIIQNRQHSPSIKKIAYHIGDNIPDMKKHTCIIGDQYEKIFEDNCKKHLKDQLPKDIKLEIVMCPPDADDLHDRFVLSDIGGISFGHGLDEYDGSGRKDVMLSILDELPYKKLWKECKSKPATFVIENNND